MQVMLPSSLGDGLQDKVGLVVLQIVEKTTRMEVLGESSNLKLQALLETSRYLFL